MSNNTIVQSYGLPAIRTVQGGTKILVEYDGAWTNDMKGAFEYACKIWEETLPTTFPIRILAKLDSIEVSPNLSKTAYNGKRFCYNELDSTVIDANIATWTQIKACHFAEMAGPYAYTFENILTRDMFQQNDIIITYYNKDNKIVNNCSFYLTETVENDKYDFVSLVLRDIARSLGIRWDKKLLPNGTFRPNIALNTTNKNLYESKILEQIYVANNYQQTYNNATNGMVTINNNHGVSWNLYAPSVWVNDLSLNYFVPDDKKLSKLMSYNFGRGSIVRDISDIHTTYFIQDILGWQANPDNLVTGIGNSIQSFSTNTINFVPFGNPIFFSDINDANEPTNQPSFSDTSSIFPHSNSNTNDNVSLDYPDLNPYKPNYGNYGCSVALLLKNGSWDFVFTSSMFWEQIDPEFIVFNHPLDDYARSCDGYLRCRVTETENINMHWRRYKTKYFLLDHLPQEVKMQQSKVLTCFDEEDYYRDVEIGIKDLEGVTRVVVSQQDYFIDLPYTYEIHDFKKGYFIATVDMDFPTFFTITSYNNNGSTISNYTLPPISGEVPLFNFRRVNNSIEITCNSMRFSASDMITSYEIQSMDKSATKYTKKSIKNNNTIDVSSLRSGYYMLILKDRKNRNHTFKFAK